MPKNKDQLHLQTITFNLTADQGLKAIMGLFARSEHWKKVGEEKLYQDYVDARNELMAQFKAQFGK